jgi:uncharacterized membrane-anchored protein YjiN (DUF445 family)
MGPWSEHKQSQRAESIKHLLATNPQMDDYMKSVWESKLNGLAQNEDEYNQRVKQVYSLMKPQNKGWVTYE